MIFTKLLLKQILYLIINILPLKNRPKFQEQYLLLTHEYKF